VTPLEGVDGNRTESPNQLIANTLRDSVIGSAALGAENSPITPDVASVIDARDSLPRCGAAKYRS